MEQGGVHKYIPWPLWFGRSYAKIMSNNILGTVDERDKFQRVTTTY